MRVHENEGNITEQVPAGPSTNVQPPPDPAASVEHQRIAMQLQTLHKRVAAAGNWFYWIAGLSVVNTLSSVFHGRFSFVTGLGVTQVIDAFIQKFGTVAAVVGLPINLFIAGVYILFGYFACRRARWAFITGMVLYGLDTLLFLLVKDILPLGFHVFALYCIYQGIKSDNLARKIEAQLQPKPNYYNQPR